MLGVPLKSPSFNFKIMLSLNTHIPIEYIKQSKKLQEIKCGNLYRRTYWGTGRKEKPYLVFPNSKSMWIKGVKDGNELRQYPAPTISDIIDNAESLFGFSTGRYVGCVTDSKYALISSNILDMCFQRKPIKEISEFIIKNIK